MGMRVSTSSRRGGMGDKMEKGIAQKSAGAKSEQSAQEGRFVATNVSLKSLNLESKFKKFPIPGQG